MLGIADCKKAYKAHWPGSPSSKVKARFVYEERIETHRAVVLSVTLSAPTNIVDRVVASEKMARVIGKVLFPMSDSVTQPVQPRLPDTDLILGQRMPTLKFRALRLQGVMREPVGTKVHFPGKESRTVRKHVRWNVADKTQRKDQDQVHLNDKRSSRAVRCQPFLVPSMKIGFERPATRTLRQTLCLRE